MLAYIARSVSPFVGGECVVIINGFFFVGGAWHQCDRKAIDDFYQSHNENRSMSFTVAREWHIQTTDVLVPCVFVSFINVCIF